MRRVAEMWVLGLFVWLAWRDWPASLIGLVIAVGIAAWMFGTVSLMVRVLDWHVERKVRNGCRSSRR